MNSRKLSVFIIITLDGYFKDLNNNMSWHRHGEEETQFSADNLRADNILLFGRITYQMMKDWWTSPQAMSQDPLVSKGMNEAEKIVFSSSLDSAEWENTRLIKTDMIAEMQRMKEQPGKNMTILGSGSIISQFASHNLIDEYQVMIDPVAIGEGTSLFHSINGQLNLKLTGSRIFRSGAALLNYVPA